MSAIEKRVRSAANISRLFGNPAGFQLRRLKILLLALVVPLNAQAIEIVVDYTFDTNGFFANQQARDALEAAASRFSQVITSDLAAVSPSGTGSGTSAGWRIGTTHPGTGASLQISTAASFGLDPLSGAGAADMYGFSGLVENQWLLFAGGRDIGPAGIGGTGTGTNFTATFDDLLGPMHRGLIPNTPGDTSNDLPVWGGSVSFDTNGVNWHFDHTTASSNPMTDFYSIALHEVGHALGMSTSWNQWNQHVTGLGTTFAGPNAVGAYNADNGAAETSLNLVNSSNPHFEDGTYTSFIFSSANPNLVGTVGLGAGQGLLMEPTADFDSFVRRFELTNVDVGVLQDLGWDVAPIPVPPALILMVSALLGIVGWNSPFKRGDNQA